MKKIVKKVFVCMLSFWILCSMLPAMTVKADLGGWTTDASGVMTITGTDIRVREFYGTLYIEGTGAIPDYIYKDKFL